jgi:hypothetical protein
MQAGAGQGAGGGGAGQGSAGGGAAGAGGSVTTCPAGGPYFPTTVLSGSRETFSGTNGVFSDVCENGDLVQYGCGVVYTMGPPGDPGPFPNSTGAVVSTNVDCDGRCVDGACPDVCPPLGTTLQYVSVDTAGNAVLTQGAGGFSYACEFFGSSGTLDCAAFQAGDAVEVVEKSGESLCVGQVTFTVGPDSDNRCKYYRCVVTPE